MSSVIQHGRRRGSSKRVLSAEEVSGMIQPPDLRQVTVLSKAEWLRIQDELNQVDEEKETMREAAKQREALHLKSKAVEKLWSNSIAGQRQKKLEAKKIREEIEEEMRKVTDKEEAEYKEQQRKEAIEKAKTQMYYETERVKGLHRALLLTEVMKEREFQIELKQRIKSAYEEVDKDFLDMVKTTADKTLRQEQEKALQKKLEKLAVAEDLKNQVKEIELVREQQMMENKKDGEEVQRRKELYQWEQKMEEEKQATLKKNLMHAQLEHLTNREIIRAKDAQKQEADEEQRKLFLSAKHKMTELRKDRENELFEEAQKRRESIKNKLEIQQLAKIDREEQRIAQAVAEQDAKEEQQLRDKEEKRAAMMESIAVHRELMRLEKEEKNKTEEQRARDRFEGKKEAYRIFSEKQQLKAQRMKEEERKRQDFNAARIAEKSARQKQLRREEHELGVKNVELIAEEEEVFQQYSQQLISAAAEAKRNVFPLCKAAREGIGGGSGPVSCGVRPSYLVQDETGAEMPTYVSGATQNIKELNQAIDIQDAKLRLGFQW